MASDILTVCLLDYVADSLSKDSDSNFDGYVNEDEDEDMGLQNHGGK